jgi:hypothetical protein
MENRIFAGMFKTLSRQHMPVPGKDPGPGIFMETTAQCQVVINLISKSIPSF